MIRVTMRPGRICIEGHSGYDIAGKDIVCAGVSTLLFSVVFAMKESGFYDFIEEKAEDGRMRIVYQAGWGKEREADAQLDVLRKGIMLLSSKYPENVSFSF